MIMSSGQFFLFHDLEQVTNAALKINNISHKPPFHPSSDLHNHHSVLYFFLICQSVQKNYV